MESESDESLSIVPPPHPHQMNVKQLSLASSPYVLYPPSLDPDDPELLKKLGLTADELEEYMPKAEPATQEEPKTVPEPELESIPEEHIERTPIVSFSSQVSEDIIYEFNKQNMLYQRYQEQKLRKPPKPYCQCYQHLTDDEDYLYDFEELNVSVRSPSGNKEKIIKQLKDFQSDVHEHQESSPADAGLPLTTPKISSYPKRLMSFDLERDPGASFVPTSRTSPRCPHVRKQAMPASCSKNFCSPKSDTFYFVSTPQTYPTAMICKPQEQRTVATETRNLNSSNLQNKPSSRYPVMDLKKTYGLGTIPKKKQVSKKLCSEKSSKKTVCSKDLVKEKLGPELTTILSSRPMHKVVSEVLEEMELDYNFFVPTSKTTVEDEECKQNIEASVSTKIQQIPFPPLKLSHPMCVDSCNQQNKHSSLTHRLLNEERFLTNQVMEAPEEKKITQIHGNEDALNQKNMLNASFNRLLIELDSNASISNKNEENWREIKKPVNSVCPTAHGYQSNALARSLDTCKDIFLNPFDIYLVKPNLDQALAKIDSKCLYDHSNLNKTDYGDITNFQNSEPNDTISNYQTAKSSFGVEDTKESNNFENFQHVSPSTPKPKPVLIEYSTRDLNAIVKRLWSPNRGTSSKNKKQAVPNALQKPTVLGNRRQDFDQSSLYNSAKQRPSSASSSFSQTSECQLTSINYATSTLSRSTLEKQKNIVPGYSIFEDNSFVSSSSPKPRDPYRIGFNYNKYRATVRSHFGSSAQSRLPGKATSKTLKHETFLGPWMHLNNVSGRSHKERTQRSCLERSVTNSLPLRKPKVTDCYIVSTTPRKASLIGQTIKFEE